MNFQDFLTALDVRVIDHDLTVKTSRTEQRRVKNIAAVGRGNDDNTLIVAETVHLNQQLVQSLFPFIMTAAQTGTSVTANCVDLIDKDNRRRVFLCLVKQVTNTRCTDTDKHLDKVRTGNREERNACFACNRTCKQGFTGTGRAHQQYAFGNTGTQFIKFFGMFEEVDNLFEFFFFLIRTGNIRKGCFPGIFSIGLNQICLAKLIHLSAAACLLEHEVPQSTHRDNHQEVRNETPQPAVVTGLNPVVFHPCIRMFLVILLNIRFNRVEKIRRRCNPVYNIVGAIRHFKPYFTGTQVKFIRGYLLVLKHIDDFRIVILFGFGGNQTHQVGR